MIGCKNNNQTQLKKENNNKTNHQEIPVAKRVDTILIDGIANEKTWKESTWLPINQVWIGKPVDSKDFSGRYKLSWSKEALYVMAEIKDDFLVDKIKNPLERWWDEDCVEMFIDEDNSGGNHQFNHNAFAYHVDTYGNVVDIIARDTPKLFNDHIESKRVTSGNKSIWEFHINLYRDSFKYDKLNQIIQLQANKKIGFAIPIVIMILVKIEKTFLVLWL